MPAVRSDEAVVLHAYDVGEADRLCILFTKNAGKIAVRVPGARKMRSRKGASVLPLQHIRLQYKEGSQTYIADVPDVITTHEACRRDVQTYAATIQGIELLLRTMEDEHPFPEVYDLLTKFLSVCSNQFHTALFPLYTLILFDLLGTLPSLSHSIVTHRPLSQNTEIEFSDHHGGLCERGESPDGITIPSELALLLRELAPKHLDTTPKLSTAALNALSLMCYSFVGSHVGSSVRSVGISRSISSGVTPI